MSLRRPSYVSPTTGSDHQAFVVSRLVHGRGDQRIAHDADAVGVRDRDGRGQHPRLADPLEAGQLAVAVQAMAAGEDRFAPRFRASRGHHGDAGPHRALADDQWTVAGDEGRVTDPNAGDIRDGIERPGLAASDGEAEVSQTHPRMLAGRRVAAHRGRVAVSSGGDPPARSTRHHVHRSGCARLPDRIAAARPIDIAEAFRDLPGLALFESARPGRNARWTYLTADPIAVLESPAAGPDPFAVARSLVGRLDSTPSSRPMRRLPRRARRVPRVRPGRRRSSACRRSPLRIRTCRPFGWRCTIGSSPSTGGPGSPGSVAARSMAMPAGWRAGSMRSMPDSWQRATSAMAERAPRPRP